MEQSSEESTASEDSGLNGKREQKDFESKKKIERGRAKSVGRNVRKNSKVSSEKLKRSKSMDRSEGKTEKDSRDKSESSEREELLTVFTKMTDMERNKFIRQQLGLKPKFTFKEKYEDRIKSNKRKSRSRSRSRERKSCHGRHRWMEESPKIKERRHQSHPERKEDRRYYDDQYHGERRKESRDNSSFRDQSNAKRKKQMPCKYFNDIEFCKYNSGHLDQFGHPKLHICAACFYKRGEKMVHSQVECFHERGKKRLPSETECFVVDEACMYFNKNGDCEYKSGHLSLDGKYARHHICKICFIRGEKKHHPAIDCKYSTKKRLQEPPSRERLESGGHERHDEKPCSYFNNNGSCRFSSGHYPGSGGFTKQVHICSCCKQFLGKDEYHPALDCRLKKKLTGGRVRKDLVSEGANELPCNSFNSGNCILKSGHRLVGETRFLHICKFCFEFRGQMKYHTQEECRVKEKLLWEIQHERQSKYVEREKKKDDGRNETRECANFSEKAIQERSPRRFEKESEDYFGEDGHADNVSSQVEETVHLGEGKQLKMVKASLIKAKTFHEVEKYVKVSPCKQPKHKEEAINQTKSHTGIDEVVEHETVLEMNLGGGDSSEIALGRSDLDKTEQESSTESDEGELDSKMIKTALKDKKVRKHSKENINSANAPVHEHDKVQDPHFLERNPFYKNEDSKTNKEELPRKRRKLERCTPRAVIRVTAASERGDNSREINEEEEKPCKEGLVRVDEVLKSSNSNVGNADSENEKNEREILKKIEHLKKLQMIELENLRKVRQ